MRLSKEIKAINYTGAIALEIRNTGFEHIGDAEAFLGIALERAKQMEFKNEDIR